MKRTTLASLFALLCAWLLPMLGTPASAAPPYRPDRILVKPKPGVATATATAMRPRIGARLHRRYPEFGLEVLQLDKTVSVEEAIRELKMSGAVEYAEPDYELHILATPNDPRYADGSMWGLHNTGQSSGTNDADIDAPEAWDIRNNAGNIIVAVIDTGVRYTHEDLAANMWRNPGETAGDGIDNDGNGLVDDVFGINAVAGNGNPNDDQGHGTHCAGTIGAVGNNGKGVVGVAWRVQLMACKFLTSTGSGATSDAIECINYARAKGAHIMSNSWGGGGFSQGLNDAITPRAMPESFSWPPRATNPRTTTPPQISPQIFRRTILWPWRAAPARRRSRAFRILAGLPWTSPRPARRSSPRSLTATPRMEKNRAPRWPPRTWPARWR